MSNELVIPPSESSTEPVKKEKVATSNATVKIGIVFTVLAAGVAYLLIGSSAQSPFVYSKKVNEVMGHQAEWRGREVRVEGLLRQGSIQFRDSPCEWRFVLEKNGADMAVRYPQCIVPDTFRDGVNLTVTVQGKLGEDQTFVANQVVPRCPSKYEMQERKGRGESTPHSNTAPARQRT